jgi:hypothetical protein
MSVWFRVRSKLVVCSAAYLGHRSLAAVLSLFELGARLRYATPRRDKLICSDLNRATGRVQEKRHFEPTHFVLEVRECHGVIELR